MNLRTILPLLFLLIGTSAIAGRIDKGYQALEIHDYFKAKKMFTKGLKYNQSSAAQGLAIIYFRTDNPFHNYDSAYTYIQMSIAGWDMEKERKKEKYQKYGFTEDSLFATRQWISSAFYAKTKSEFTEQSFNTFIANHPWANEIDAAIATRDSIAFFAAVKENTSTAYKSFTDAYPKSVYAELALQNFYDTQFAEITGDGTLESFKVFIEKNPNSPLLPEAERNVFELSTSNNSLEAYSGFITDNPSNRYVDSAWLHLFQIYVAEDYSKDKMQEFMENINSPLNERTLKEIEFVDSTILPFAVNHQYGFMNAEGIEFIERDYEYAGYFQEGLAIIVKEEKFGYINKFGELQIEPQFESANNFVNGLAIVELKGKYGLINRNGRFIFECKYDDLGSFSEGLVYAELNGEYGYYDRSGELIIEHQYDDAYDFNDGVAKVENENKQGYINQKGLVVVPMIYEEIRPYFDTMYVFQEDGKYGLINHKGQMFIEPMYDAIGTLQSGLAVAASEDRLVYLDTIGTMVIDNGYELFPNYLVKGEFVDGKAIVYKKEKYGRINWKDELVTPFEFENIGEGVEVFPAQEEGLWGIYTSQGNTLVSPLYDEMILIGRHAIATQNDTVGVIDFDGNTIVPFAYEEIEELGEELFVVKQSNKFGVYWKEKLIIPIMFDQVGIFNEDFLFLSKAGTLKYFNRNTGEILEQKGE